MATKMKSAGETFKDTAETVAKNGADAFKNGFEKAVKGYDQVLGFGKENVEAYLKAANAAGKGVEAVQNEMYLFSKQSVEETMAATKAVLGAKSVHEAFEIQSDFAKSAFDTYVGQINRFNEIVLSVSKETFEPLQGRIQAWAEVVQTARAA
ncbi:MAG TPA: phasin family protein [Rhizomicrobium sp.]|jgi:phasin family protein|nr:phasin family protein [Rhizomicrobium sp.]